MLRAMLRDLRAHRGRLAMTLVAIALGVAFVVASFVVSDSLAKTLAGQTARGGVDVSVQTASQDPDLTLADRDALAATNGVAEAHGVIAGRAGVVGTDGKLVSTGTDLAGTNWDETGRFTLVDGRGPQRPGEVALAESRAGEARLALGDRARIVLGDGRIDEPVVVGLFQYSALGPDAAGRSEHVPSIAYDGATAASLVGDRFDRIELTGTPGTEPSTLRQAAEQTIGAGHATDEYSVSTGAELVTNAEQAADKTASDTLAQLLPFAAIALLVGMFVITNTFSLLVTQRTRQFALLRAVGAHRRQVRSSVVVEATALACVGATIGTVLGIGLGLIVFRFMQPEGDVVRYGVPLLGVGAGYLVAVLVTVAAAYGAARRAAAVSPMAALRNDVVTSKGPHTRQSIAGGICVVAGLVAIVATASPGLGTLERMIAIGGAVLCTGGVLLLTPVAAGALRPLATWSQGWGGPATRLGMRNAARDPRRTATTATTLMVGLGLVCAFATLSSSLATMVTASIRLNIPVTSTVLEPAAGGAATLGPGVVGELRSLPAVSTVLASRDTFAEIRHEGGTSERIVSAIDREGLGEVLTPKITEGTDDVSRGAIIAQNEANMLGLAVGDPLELVVEGTPVKTAVVGVYDATEAQASIFFDQALAPPHLRDHVTTVYAGGPDPQAAREAIATAFQDRPEISITDRDGVIADRVEEFRYGLLVMYAMFGVAIVIAVFGVVNTLALSVMERSREIGVTRAVGAGRALVRRTIRVESIVISLFGGILGVGVGVGTGTVMQHAMLGQALSRATLPWTLILLALVGIVIVGVLASLWPAHRAARTNMLEAIGSD
ncbi:ABC transporter permease [Saccharopolyspora sp. 6V]|uniref:ABC transporter permease n=1 Tax=Saccharopolyspora sp. 6V TaxID=2877239 RepID=UPI001CD56608|nr:ABC transporter permease [Saccharopolyspora sp. 6V]MCA1191398.1 ABC transporter permease [Saccharopolyspora sp. 6V]